MKTSLGLLTVLCCMPAVGVASDEPITADQFLRIVKTMHAPLEDVAFAFEGEEHFVGAKGEAERPPVVFQGRYAIRSDGATFWETVIENARAGREQHQVRAMLRGMGEFSLAPPKHLPGLDLPVRKEAAGPGTYFSPISPETFLFHWRYWTLISGKPFGYKFIAWEDVDNRRCARIEFAAHPGASSPVVQELWVDLERGANPLQIRNRIGDDTVYLVDQVKLRECDLPSGEKVWFPVHGRFNRFHHEGKYTPVPMFQTTTYVLNGALEFNQGLKDGVFHVKGASFRPSFQPRGRDEARRVKRQAPEDLEAAEKALDAALAEPGRKGLEQDASKAAREEGARSARWTWAAGVGGGVTLALGCWLAWRSRRSA